jgi:hypothetical protein
MVRRNTKGADVMKLFSRLLVGVVLSGAVGAAVLTPVFAATVAPVTVKQCFVTEPKPFSKNASGTQIDYIIHGSKNAKSITFAVGYRNAQENFLRKVQDVGNFAPGTEIMHHFSLYNDVTYAGKNVTSCFPVSVKWSDSTTWLAPAH